MGRDGRGALATGVTDYFPGVPVALPFNGEAYRLNLLSEHDKARGAGGNLAEVGFSPGVSPPNKNNPYLKDAILGSAGKTPTRSRPLKIAAAGKGLRGGGSGAGL